MPSSDEANPGVPEGSMIELPQCEFLVFIGPDLVQVLQWWIVDVNCAEKRPFLPSLHMVTVTMDASMEGGGG